MSHDANRFSPFDADRPLLMRCHWGADDAAAEHDRTAPTTATAAPVSGDIASYSRDFIEASLVKALLQGSTPSRSRRPDKPRP